MELGFIGLGAMGEPMARNLLKAGHAVTVYNRTPSRAEKLLGEGATLAATAGHACLAGVVVTMVADDQALEAVTSGEAGILQHLPKGGVHVSHSTISTAISRRLTEAHQQCGQHFVAAPVFGRPDAAAAKRLMVVAAGPSQAVERCHPLLEGVGRKLFVIGSDPPAANAVKLSGNFLIASMIESLGEACALLRKSGVDPTAFLEIMVGSFFQSPVYETYGSIIAEQRFDPPGFKMRLGLKDVRLMMAAAEEVGAPLPIASLIRDNMISGIAQGMGELDWAAVARVAALKAGLKS